MLKRNDMLITGLIIIIFALLIRLMRDPIGHLMLQAIDSGYINDSNRPQYRLLWRFLLHTWKPAIVLGIGLVITKLIQL